MTGLHWRQEPAPDRGSTGNAAGRRILIELEWGRVFSIRDIFRMQRASFLLLSPLLSVCLTLAEPIQSKVQESVPAVGMPGRQANNRNVNELLKYDEFLFAGNPVVRMDATGVHFD